jgi:hypothetical protein
LSLLDGCSGKPGAILSRARKRKFADRAIGMNPEQQTAIEEKVLMTKKLLTVDLM